LLARLLRPTRQARPTLLVWPALLVWPTLKTLRHGDMMPHRI
jgi:hypothetical protein